MNLQTVRTISKELGVNESIVRRTLAAGKLDAIHIGTRVLIDMDTAAEVLKPAAAGIGIEEVSQATGLSVSAIRRGIREGWIPCTKPGKKFLFQLDEVVAALRAKIAAK